MKFWIMAGLFSAAALPFAGAAQASTECQVDDGRRVPQVRIDGGSPGGSAPATAAPASAPHGPAPERAVRREAESTRSTATDRRRSGKHIPDAELIAPRGAL